MYAPPAQALRRGVGSVVKEGFPTGRKLPAPISNFSYLDGQSVAVSRGDGREIARLVRGKSHRLCRRGSRSLTAPEVRMCDASFKTPHPSRAGW